MYFFNVLSFPFSKVCSSTPTLWPWEGQSLNKPLHALFVLVILTQGLYLRILFVQLWTRFISWWGGNDFLGPLVFNMFSYLWLLSRWFTSVLTPRRCESLPLTVGVNTTWHSNYGSGKGYRELQFLDHAQSTQETLGENTVVDSQLQVLAPASGRSVHDSNALKIISIFCWSCSCKFIACSATPHSKFAN